MNIPINLSDKNIAKSLDRIAEALESLVEIGRKGNSTISMSSRYQDLEQKEDYKSSVFYEEDAEDRQNKYDPDGKILKLDK